jgi:hypothetical protein
MSSRRKSKKLVRREIQMPIDGIVIAQLMITGFKIIQFMIVGGGVRWNRMRIVRRSTISKRWRLK